MNQCLFEIFLNIFIFGFLFLVMSAITFEFRELKNKEKIFKNNRDVDKYFYRCLYILFIVLDTVFLIVTVVGLILLIFELIG